MKSRTRVVGICGSLRRGSYTRMALRIALRGAEEAGVEAQLIDLREYQLAFCDGGDDKKLPKDVQRLRDDVQRAQGIILATPEYRSLRRAMRLPLNLAGACILILYVVLRWH